MTDYVICANLACGFMPISPVGKEAEVIDSIVLKDADEIQSFYIQATGMTPDYLPLSARNSGISLRFVELDGINLIWARASGMARWRDQIAGVGLQIGFMISSDGRATVLGQDVGQQIKTERSRRWYTVSTTVDPPGLVSLLDAKAI